MFHKEEAACHLLSVHNIYFLFRTMRRLRQAIIDNTLEEFVRGFMVNWFGKSQDIPNWVVEALDSVEIRINKNI